MQKYTNKGSVPWYPKESRTPCKNALNNSTIASSISRCQGRHLFHYISPMSLQDVKKLYTRTHGLTHKRFYTQMRFTHTLSHTDAFTRKRFLHTQTRFHTQMLLHTDAFKHKHFYTNESVHRNFSSVFDVQRPFRATIDQVKSQFFLNFWRPASISRVRVAIN